MKLSLNSRSWQRSLALVALITAPLSYCPPRGGHTEVRASAVEMHLFEVLEYRLSYLKLPAGRITFTQRGGGVESETIELVVTAETVAAYGALFPLDNVYRCTVDAGTLLPLTLHKSIQQKNIVQEMTVQFDHRRSRAYAADSLSWPIAENSRDFVSLIHYLRKTPLAPDERRTLHVDTEGMTCNVTAAAGGSGAVRTPLGRFKADKVTLDFAGESWQAPRKWDTDLLTNRLSQQDVRLSIWFSRDAGRIPLQIEYHSSPFSVILTLVKAPLPLP